MPSIHVVMLQVLFKVVVMLQVMHHASKMKPKDVYQISNATRIGIGTSNQKNMKHHQSASPPPKKKKQTPEINSCLSRKNDCHGFFDACRKHQPYIFHIYPSFPPEIWLFRSLPEVPLQSHHKSGYGREAILKMFGVVLLLGKKLP